MKKIFTSLLTTLFVGFLGIVSSTPNVSVTHALSREVPISKIPAADFVGGELKSASYTNDGLKIMIEGADTWNLAWQKNAIIPSTSTSNPKLFSLENNEKISLEFSVKFFESDGTLVSKSVNDYAFDLYIINPNNNEQLGMLRINTDSGSATNGDHSVIIYTSDWEHKYDSSYWIKGDATEESSFYIEFDKENFISSYVAGNDGVVPLGSAEQIEDRKNALKDIDQVCFKIQGNNGYTNETQVVIKSINGQSLANDGVNFIDDTAPVINNAKVNSSIPVNQEYTIPLEATDVLSDVSYKMIINGEEILGKTFTPTTMGTLDVTFIAEDGAGNTSQKDLTFEVVGKIDKPIITKLPTIEDIEVSALSNIVFEKPEFTDETGSATTVLKIYNEDDTLFATLSENSDHQFVYFADGTFQSGNYKIVYEITNSAGTTTSDAQMVSITLKAKQKVDFITGETSNMFAEYVDEGIALSSSDNYRQHIIGVYDLRNSLDVKFIINETTINGLKNDTEYFNFILTSEENPNITFRFRVWSKFSGIDAPTNVYVSSDNFVTFGDYSNTGWISRNVDGIDNCYHMSFNYEDTFVGEQASEAMTPITTNAADHIRSLYNSLTSKRFIVGFEASRNGGGSLFETIIKDINTQSFTGDFSWEDIDVSIKSDMPENIAVNDSLNLDIYAKDIQGNEEVKVIVTKPNGESETIDVVDGKVNIAFDQIGTYSVVVVAKGSNGQEVRKAYNLVCKSTLGAISINVNGTYDAVCDLNKTIDILEASYSGDVTSTAINIIKPNGESVEVSANSQYEFKTPGIYKIVYSAQDNAEPTPNVVTKEFLINVPDTLKPVVNVTLKESYNLNDEVKLGVSVTDDSDYDVSVTLTKPDGTSEKSTNKKTYSFKVTQAGQYTVKVVVEDVYGNKETVTKVFTVVDSPNSNKDETKSNNLVLIVCLCGGVAVVGGMTALTIVLKKKKANKNKNEEIISSENNNEGQETGKE